jgi:hypothetical protein
LAAGLALWLMVFIIVVYGARQFGLSALKQALAYVAFWVLAVIVTHNSV